MAEQEPHIEKVSPPPPQDTYGIIDYDAMQPPWMRLLDRVFFCAVFSLSILMILFLMFLMISGLWK